jgi:hypothetical protein
MGGVNPLVASLHARLPLRRLISTICICPPVTGALAMCVIMNRSDLSFWPVASLAAVQANVGVQGNSGSRCRMAQTTRLTHGGLVAEQILD